MRHDFMQYSDAHAMYACASKIQIGSKFRRGQGAGANPR